VPLIERPTAMDGRRPWDARVRSPCARRHRAQGRHRRTLVAGTGAIRFPPRCRGVVDAESSFIQKEGASAPGTGSGSSEDARRAALTAPSRHPTSLVKSSPAWFRQQHEHGRKRIAAAPRPAREHRATEHECSRSCRSGSSPYAVVRATASKTVRTRRCRASAVPSPSCCARPRRRPSVAPVRWRCWR